MKPFNVSKNRARSIVKKFKATKKLTNKIARGWKCKISKVLEKKLVQIANNNPRVTAATLMSDAANSRVTVSKKTVAWVLHRNGLHAHRPCKTPLQKKRHLSCDTWF